MHGHPWFGFVCMVLVSVGVAMLFHELVRLTTGRMYRWEDVKRPVRWASAGLGLFGMLFYVALVLHVFR